MSHTIDPLSRNHVRVVGDRQSPMMMFSHGFGGSQASWNDVWPAFRSDHAIVLFDHAGAGGYDMAAYDRARYGSLYGYADDVIEILDALGATDVVYVGHSVSGIVGVLAANQRPELFSKLVLLGPSPRYLDDDGYVGGFTREAIDGLLTAMDSNYLSWSAELAPVLMGETESPALTEELARSIQSIDPEAAAQFARATFLSDNRRDLADVTVPTLILQSVEDNIASPVVGRFVHEQIPGSRFEVIDARGHVPHLSAPDEVIRHISDFVRRA